MELRVEEKWSERGLKKNKKKRRIEKSWRGAHKWRPQLYRQSWFCLFAYAIHSYTPLMVGWFREFSLNLVYLQLLAEQQPGQTGDLFESINTSRRKRKKICSDRFQNSLFSGLFPFQPELDYLFQVISERDLTQRFKLFHSFRFCFFFSLLFSFTPPSPCINLCCVLHAMILMWMMIATLYLFVSLEWNEM